MTDAQLIQLFLPIIQAGLIADGFSGVSTIQNNQPTQQGMNSNPTVYYSKISSKLFGYRGYNDNSTFITKTGTLAVNSKTITGLSTTVGLFVGQNVSGQYIVPGSVIASIVDSTTITLSIAATYSATTLLSFYTTTQTENQWMESTWQIGGTFTQNPSTPNQMTASDLVQDVAYILQSVNTVVTLNAAGVGIYRITNVLNPYFLNDQDQYYAFPNFTFTLTYLQPRTGLSPVVIYPIQTELVRI